MKRTIAMLLLAALVTVACSDGDTVATETTDTAATDTAEAPKKDFATRVGDTVATATDKADELKEQENERVDEVNQAMDE